MRLMHTFRENRKMATHLRFSPPRPAATLFSLIAAAAIALSPCSPGSQARVATPEWSPNSYADPAEIAPRSAQRDLNDLSSPDQLQQLFESDKGKLRILALLSPT